MLKHFIYSSSSKLTTSFLCSLYYKYSSKVSSFFYILSFLVRATFIDQTFYSVMYYLAAMWLDSRHDLNINKHRRNVTYEVNDWVWLSFKNIKTMKLCKDLKDKQLDLYQITAKVNIFYHLHLSVSMKHLHLIFSSKLLWLYSEDSLSEQHSKSLRSIIIKDDEHWKINNILNFRRYWDWIQYKVKWKDLDRNDEWYYVDKEKFNNSEKVLNEFHKLYSSKSR